MRKTTTDVRIKDADQGTVEAVFSTFDVVDKDGDVTLKGAIADGTPVVISGYGHTSWDGALPVGKGVVRTTDTEAILEGQFFIDTTHGRDAFLTVKELSAVGLQQWSYSLRNVKSEAGEVDGRKVRILHSIEVDEVSPVLVGAGVDTRTLSAKSDTPTKFSECADIALRGVKQLVEMATERLTHRAAEGKSVDEQRDAYDLLVAELAPLRKAIDDATQPTPLEVEDDIAANDIVANELVRYLTLTEGVTLS